MRTLLPALLLAFGASAAPLAQAQSCGSGGGATVCLTAGGTANNVQLSWTTSGTIRSLEIYRDTDANPVGRTRIAIPAASATSYIDATAANGTPYWYWVKFTTNAGSYNSGSASATRGTVCTPTAITPYISANGSWTQTSSATVTAGNSAILGPQPVSGGSWTWSGCGTSGSAREQLITPAASCTATATYTNSCGAKTTQAFAITVPGSTQAKPFEWKSSEPLIKPPADRTDIFGVKDPSIVYHDGRYHVFMTTAGKNGWGLAYTSFANWQDAPTAPRFMLDKSPMGPGYRAAPQVFYFAPHKLWYLIYQGGDPLYSTSSNIADPMSWTAPKPFYPTIPESVKDAKGNASWLDFWNICDDRKCHLFFTGDNGSFYRGETTIDRFPQGFAEPVVVMKEKTEDMFEASNTYKISGTNQYLTLIEAMGPKGRYFRAWTADRLDGTWQPIPGAPMNLFAGTDNVKFDGRIWSEGVSHGEMIRDGIDQTLSIDPCQPLRFLFQGLDLEPGKEYPYIELPYRLGLITATAPNAISVLCKK